MIDPQTAYIVDLNAQIVALTARCEALEAAMRGWDGYGWKDRKYIDSLPEFFAGVLAPADGESK